MISRWSVCCYWSHECLCMGLTGKELQLRKDARHPAQPTQRMAFESRERKSRTGEAEDPALQWQTAEIIRFAVCATARLTCVSGHAVTSICVKTVEDVPSDAVSARCVVCFSASLLIILDACIIGRPLAFETTVKSNHLLGTTWPTDRGVRAWTASYRNCTADITICTGQPVLAIDFSIHHRLGHRACSTTSVFFTGHSPDQSFSGKPRCAQAEEKKNSIQFFPFCTWFKIAQMMCFNSSQPPPPHTHTHTLPCMRHFGIIKLWSLRIAETTCLQWSLLP